MQRRLLADRAVEGEPVEAMIEVTRGPLGLPGGEVRDPLAGMPVAVGRPLALITGAAKAEVRVVARFPRRGLRRLEPPALAVGDMLGLATRVRSGEGPTQELLVLPRTEPVRWSTRQSGRRLEGGDGGPAEEPLAASDIDGLRPYRPGTSASRIHWSALARGAGLLERRLQADGDTRPLVVLDSRCANATTEDQLDGAVRAAASLILELARRGGCRALLPGERRAVVVESDLMSWPGSMPDWRWSRAARAPGRHGSPRARARTHALRRSAAARARSGGDRRAGRGRLRARAPAQRHGAVARRGDLRRRRLPGLCRRRPGLGREGTSGVSTGAQVAVLDARGVKRPGCARTRTGGAARLPARDLRCARALCGVAVGDDAEPGADGANARPARARCALAAAGPWLRQRSALLLVFAIVVAVILLFALSGLPVRWVRHLRVSASADAIDEGLSSLPRAFIPYNGINEWVRVVIVLGGGLLLLLAAIPLAFAPRTVGEMRRRPRPRR